MLPYKKSLRTQSRKLRSSMTDAERALWVKLRGKQLLGLQFYRQKTLGNYIVDFYCAAARLVIEVDGGQHYQPDGATQDALRDCYLKSLGLEVLRFSNLEGSSKHGRRSRSNFSGTGNGIQPKQDEIPPAPFFKGGVVQFTRQSTID